MEKIKSVISGHRKSTDAPSSPTTPHSGKDATGEIPHPIYDQFTGKGNAPGEPTKATDNAPHFSNTTNVRQAEPGTTTGASSLHPDAAHSRPDFHDEEMSTASIKSSVIGFPQGTNNTRATSGNSRPAEQRSKGNQIVGGGGTSDHHSYGATHTSGLDESTASTGTDRSFPLVGGVTHNRPTEKSTTSEREPGTKEKEVGVHDGQGKEALTGAAAAATLSSGRPRTESERDVGAQLKGTHPGQSYHPEALATATAAAATTSPHAHGQEHSQEGERHIAFRGSPEASSDQYTRPSPVTNISEEREPRLHIPGEFPSPTPVNQSSAPSYFQSKDTTTVSSDDPPELRHTGTLDHPQTRSTDENEKSEHHYGRDAAVAGRLGVARAGANAAGTHGQNESTQTAGEIFPTEASPYSSTKIDPRVDNRPAPSYDQQKYAPATPSKHQGRDAILTGGAQPTTTQPQPPSQPKDEKSQHHYGRDAALVGAGAGAATTASLYANQRSNDPNSGPSKSTIDPKQTDTANILDPRVQPDPVLQKHHHTAPTVGDPAPSTTGPHKSNAANILDPRVLPDPQKQKAQPKDEHNYGRDATLVGGTGGAGYGAYEAAKSYGGHRATQPVASMNEQRYDPTAPGAHNPSLGTTHLTEDQHQKRQHHYGRDAAIGGGVGAAGLGAYGASRGNEPSQQSSVAQQHYPSTQTTQQPPVSQQQYAPQATQQPQESQHHYGRDTAVGGGLGAAGAGAYTATRRNDRTQQLDVAHPQYTPYQATEQPIVGQQQYLSGQSNQYPQMSTAAQQPQPHYGRDAAVIGGLGAAGAGAYAATRGNDGTQQPGVAQQQYPIQPSSQSSFPQGTQQHQRYDSAHYPTTQHQKRDAAALGTAAGAGGAYAYSQHNAEKERLAAEKAQEQQLKDRQKDFEKKQRKQEKAFHDKQKAIDHQHSKDQKHHNKLVAAEDKKHQKEVEKEQREQQKEAEKAHPEEEGEKKKHHLFGFLHRDKDKSRTSGESNRRQSGDSPRHSKEYAGAGAAAGVGGAAAYEGLDDSDIDKKGQNKLHKEPPPGHPAREAMEHQQHPEHQRSPITGKRQHFGTDGPIGNPNMISGDRPISSGVYSVDEPDTHHNTVTESDTRLPMNVEKYGPGAGGIDGNSDLERYHKLSPEAR